MKYELLDSDKYKRVKLKKLNKGNNGQMSSILKNNKRVKKQSEALGVIISIFILAGAIFICLLLIGGTVQGNVTSISTPVFALEQEQVGAKTVPLTNEQGAGQVFEQKPNSLAEAPIIIDTPATCASEIAKYDWQQDIAIAVMKAESGGNTNAKNDNPATGDYSIGCFQINIYGANAKSRPSELELYDPKINVAFAYRLYSSSGWRSQWGAYRNNSYLRYL